MPKSGIGRCLGPFSNSHFCFFNRVKYLFIDFNCFLSFLYHFTLESKLNSFKSYMNSYHNELTIEVVSVVNKEVTTIFLLKRREVKG